MTDLRNSVFLLIAFLIVVFGISNVQSFEDNVLDFHPTFFIMLTLAAFGGILIPSRFSIYFYVGLWTVIYILVWFYFYRFLPDPRNAQELGVQFLLIEISAGLSYFVGRQVQQIDALVRGLAISAYPNRTIDIKTGRELINTEVTRSRRYKRPFSTLVFKLEFVEKRNETFRNEAIQRDLLRRFALAKMGQIINEFARQTDMVFSDQFDRFILLCPETDSQKSTVLAERICKSVNEKMDARVTWGTASFPHDALTFDDLVVLASQRLQVNGVDSVAIDHEVSELGQSK